jgi:hypothetical protein
MSVRQALFGFKKLGNQDFFLYKVIKPHKKPKKWPPSSPLSKSFQAIIYKFKHGVFDSR